MAKQIWIIVAGMLMLASCPAGDTAGGSTSGKQPTVSNSSANQDDAPSAANATEDLTARGFDIFHTTEYSNTSLACAHCHADSVQTGEEHIFIASSGHGSAGRGAWKITSQAMLDAGEGRAKTLIDAANFCVRAPYMDHSEKLIEGSDAEALTAYLESIGTKDEPFVIAKPKAMPVGGLMFDEESGYRVFATSCKTCHDSGLPGVPELSGASGWINALQAMAKVRGIGNDYYSDWADLKYEDYANGEEIPIPATANPGSENPCGEDGAGDVYGAGDKMFSQGAMPFYTTETLSDQQVVDVAYFLSTVL